MKYIGADVMSRRKCAASAIRVLTFKKIQIKNWRIKMWISVKDRLPQTNKWVLAAKKHHGRFVYYVTQYSYGIWSDLDVMVPNVKYWMDIPTPPKTKEE